MVDSRKSDLEGRSRLRSVAGGLVGTVCLALLALGLGILVPLAPAQTVSTLGKAPDTRRVLLLSGPIHTDLALPATPDIRRRFAFLTEAGLPVDRPDVASVVVGWGGRSFYLETPTWADMRPLPLLRSFTSDASVLHLELAGAIAPDAAGVRAIDLGEAAFEALVQAVEATLARDAAGRPLPIEGSGYGAFDRFFEAKGRFNALAGCNVWTARMLRAAGLPTGIWTPLPQTLLLSLDLHGE